MLSLTSDSEVNAAWDAEKTSLRFVNSADFKRSLDPSIFKDWQTVGRIPGYADSTPLLDFYVYLGGCLLAQAQGWKSGSQLYLIFTIAEDYVADVFLLRSLAKVSALEANRIFKGSPPQLKIDAEPLTKLLTAFGEVEFQFSQGAFCYSVDHESAVELFAMKEYLRNYLIAAPYLGRGSLIDVSGLNIKKVDLLNAEYQDVAWGPTEWARHSKVAADELKIIEQFCRGKRGLEVGGGSGRVTESLIGSFDELFVSDISPTSIKQLKSKFAIHTHVKITHDDISGSSFTSDFFDVVMFWENGLGAMLTPEARRTAVAEMSRLTKPGGRLVIGVRNLLPISVDQVMVAAQTDLVLGIYHTFSKSEVLELVDSRMQLVDQITGDERPAGGFQMFFVFEKVL